MSPPERWLLPFGSLEFRCWFLKSLASKSALLVAPAYLTSGNTAAGAQRNHRSCIPETGNPRKKDQIEKI